MKRIRRMMSKKEDPEWRKLSRNWQQFINHSFDSALMTTDNWNPWKEWYASFETFTASEAKVPKSFKQKAALWFQLQPMALLTANKLEELTITRAVYKQQREELESLKKDKLVLEIKCQSLKKDKLVLEEKCQKLQRQLAMNKQQFEEDLETEAAEIISLEEANTALHDKVEKITTKFQKASKKCTELENEVSVLKLQQELTKNRDQLNNERQVDKYDPKHNHESLEMQPHRPLRVGQMSLEMSEIEYWVKILGRITKGNVADWLCDCEILMQFWCWTPVDLLMIFCGCMDIDTYLSLLTKEKMGQATWLTICRDILETFRIFSKTNVQVLTMRDDDSVSGYFRRMWLYYRINNPTKYVSKNDHEYKSNILNGLLPHLSNNASCSQDYDTLQEIVLSAEELWNESEDQGQRWHCEAMKAGVGCPSRKKIWNRLRKYEDPRLRLNNATYWRLVVALSRYEDLGTHNKVEKCQFVETTICGQLSKLRHLCTCSY